jgi:hypothetical protein
MFTLVLAFQIFDIHALQEQARRCCRHPARAVFFLYTLFSPQFLQFYFGDNVLIRLKSCIYLLIDRLLALPDFANVVIAFPDEGAFKRFGGKFDAFGDPIVCAKRREGDKRRVVVNEGDPRGKHGTFVRVLAI